MRRTSILAGALLLLAVSVQAQVVGGRIIDRANRKPMRDVKVIGIDAVADSASSTSAQTNSAGEFYLNLPRAGEYRIELHVSGRMPIDAGSIKLKEGEFLQRQFVLDLVQEDRAHFDFEVDKVVAPRPSNRGPRYPPEMRDRYMNGEVLVQFVVGIDGRAEMKTFRAVKSTDPLFTEAVRDAVRWMRFFPAEKGGRPVRQLVQQPFNFTITF